MNRLDRYILRSLVFNYVVALAIMMCLYVVLDLFFNMDEFTESGKPVWRVLADVGSYYGVNSTRYFAQLSGAITLFACMSALARMRRMNELTAVLASGVSLYRVASPVLAFGVVTTLLWYIDTEWIIPSFAHQLSREHDDAEGAKTFGVWFLNDRDGALLSAREFLPQSRDLHGLLVLERDGSGRLSSVIEAETARWEPQAGHPDGGWWELEAGRRRTRVDLPPEVFASEEPLRDQPWPRYESDLTPEDIEARQATQWTRSLGTSQLIRLLESGHVDAPMIRQVLHARVTAPLVNLLLLLLGIPIILNRVPGTVLNDSVKCLVVAGSCFLLAFVGQSLGHTESWPALPAWLPLLVFAPVASVLIHRMKT